MVKKATQRKPRAMKKPRDEIERAVDVREVFRKLSVSMKAEFDQSAQIPHATGMGSMREEVVRKFLRDYLPSRYAVGQGQIIHSTNRISKQTDVVIHDHGNCPRLFVNQEHSIFPLEGVYGVVSIKSTLSSNKLANAFENIASTKSLVEEDKTIVLNKMGTQIGVASPLPVGIVFAFDADRSLEAIATQAKTLQDRLSNPKHAPDLIAVLGKGLVGPRVRVRDDFNRTTLPAPTNRMLVREVRRHTLLRLYLQLLSELNTITLPPLSLDDYLQMPELVDGHRVIGLGPHFLMPRGQPLPTTGPPLRKLSTAYIKRVISETEGTSPITFREHLTHSVGNTDVQGLSPERLSSSVVEYNPRHLPSKLTAGLDCATGETESPAYTPMYIKIDGQEFAIDTHAISSEDWERCDVEFDEIFDPRPLLEKNRQRR
jgi:hypothetical protein